MATKKNPMIDDAKNQRPASATADSAKTLSPTDSGSGRKAGVTRLKVRYNCGFGNNLFIRGKGANLSWDKGQPLKNLKHDEWVWETTVPFSTCEFKLLINDVHYEQGNNHRLQSGDSSEYTPRF